VHTVIKNVWLQPAAGLQVTRQLWLLLHWHLCCGHKDQGQVRNWWESKMWLRAVVGPQWRADLECTHVIRFSVSVSIKATKPIFRDHVQVKEVQIQAAAGHVAMSPFWPFSVKKSIEFAGTNASTQRRVRSNQWSMLGTKRGPKICAMRQLWQNLISDPIKRRTLSMHRQ